MKPIKKDDFRTMWKMAGLSTVYANDWIYFKPDITSLSKVSLFEVYSSIGNIFSQGESRHVISLQSTVYES